MFELMYGIFIFLTRHSVYFLLFIYIQSVKGVLGGHGVSPHPCCSGMSLIRTVFLNGVQNLRTNDLEARPYFFLYSYFFLRFENDFERFRTSRRKTDNWNNGSTIFQNSLILFSIYVHWKTMGNYETSWTWGKKEKGILCRKMQSAVSKWMNYIYIFFMYEFCVVL